MDYKGYTIFKNALYDDQTRFCITAHDDNLSIYQTMYARTEDEAVRMIDAITAEMDILKVKSIGHGFDEDVLIGNGFTVEPGYVVSDNGQKPIEKGTELAVAKYLATPFKAEDYKGWYIFIDGRFVCDEEVYYTHGNALFKDDFSELSCNLFDDYQKWFIKGSFYTADGMDAIARANQNAAIMVGNDNEDRWV